MAANRGARFRKQAAALAAALALLLPGAGRGSGRWETWPDSRLPADSGFLVQEYTGSVRITFLGDCTLGGEEKSRNNALGFLRRIRDNGLDFPLRGLKALTEADDLSIANLEGVLTDRELKKEEKKYNFSGPTAYTGILEAGSIECVTLANNHSHDYGEAGYQDTKAALDAAGICYFGTDCSAVWQNEEGLRLGFIGVSYSLSGDRTKRYRAKMEALREMGCAAVITVMHAGTEYVYTPDDYQRQIAQRASKAGSELIIGHHPHVVQGYDVVGGTPVVYSLGNCSFGGTTHAKDSDALVVQAVLDFEEGVLEGITLHFYPISITSDARYNNYSPQLLTGKDAEGVLKKLEESTGRSTGTFDEAEGAVVRFPAAGKDGNAAQDP